MKKILIVDDDRVHRIMLKVNLKEAGYKVIEADDGDQVLPVLAEHDVDLILMDLKMQRMTGIEAIKLLQKNGRPEPVVVITAFSSVESAVEAMKHGAMDYVTKPVDIESLKLTVAKALDFEALRGENEELKKRLGEQFDFRNIIGRSPAMAKVFETLALVAPSDATVLINGESGTGKELIAGALHHNSKRKEQPFIKVNCAALNENLLESELFGHEKGSFTGADRQRKGRFELADKGTLFLDEIGDMSAQTQAKILRVLQEGELERLGGSETTRVDVRLVAATHRDLNAMVAQGSFRQDLFFRLSVVPIELPPLRQRTEDIPALADFFLTRYAKKNQKDIKGIHPQALMLLARYSWPGNIRELENSIERAVILCLGEQITPKELPPQMLPDDFETFTTPLDAQGGQSLKDVEREAIRITLKQTDGNRSKTAKTLGIARQTLINKIKAYGL
ncbi:MAG: sigma-54-dependent Fis family transcriptional regulator [Desulfocapsa sp.]|jgi:DNA-binding NtrC family response regulator|nr:sigma-54-dependent Fis family transcriptional regulator [Desulfocapsa sp.]